MEKVAFLFTLFFLYTSFPVQAEESMAHYTFSDEVYYEIFIIQSFDKSVTSAYASEKEIDIRVTYPETVIPPKTYYYSITENNITYSGTLNLYKVYSTNGKTYAYYRGTLYASD